MTSPCSWSSRNRSSIEPRSSTNDWFLIRLVNEIPVEERHQPFLHLRSTLWFGSMEINKIYYKGHSITLSSGTLGSTINEFRSSEIPDRLSFSFWSFNRLFFSLSPFSFISYLDLFSFFYRLSFLDKRFFLSVIVKFLSWHSSVVDFNY